MSKEKIISEHIFAPNGGYCVYYPSLEIFFARRTALKIGEYHLDIPNNLKSINIKDV